MFKPGDKVKDCYGSICTVISVHDHMLYVDTNCGSWLHSTKATLLSQRKGY